MLFLLAFLLFFGAASTLLLLAVDAYYAHADLDHRLDHSFGRHWAPNGTVLLEDRPAASTMLPEAVRPKLWVLAGTSFVLGSILLLVAA